jgi:hydroxypyruvate reductase
MPRANQGEERALLERVYRAAIGAVEPASLVRARLVAGDAHALRTGERRAARIARRTWLIAAGKAAGAMAREAARIVGPRLSGGIVASPDRVSDLPRALRHFVAGHPLPNRQSLEAGRNAWRLAAGARRGDLVLVLLSGGASSLLVLPAPGISLSDKILTGALLLRSGATIRETNSVRKHLSRLKGGGLLRRAGAARVVGLILSDVIGGSAAVVGSGPTAADPTTFADALRVLRRRRILDRIPRAVRRHLELGLRGSRPETLKPGECRPRNFLIGDNRLALQAARATAQTLGLRCRILTASMRGDTEFAAARFAAEVRRRVNANGSCLLAGGETTVTVRGDGRGGRNQHFALALAEGIAGLEAACCLIAGTDGRDGPTDAAGAFVDGTTIERARRRGLDPHAFLRRNDSYSFFAALGDLFRPGPTGTNVMDLEIAIVGHVAGPDAAC